MIYAGPGPKVGLEQVQRRVGLCPRQWVVEEPRNRAEVGVAGRVERQMC